jgi:hypothetical protein
MQASYHAGRVVVNDVANEAIVRAALGIGATQTK